MKWIINAPGVDQRTLTEIGNRVNKSENPEQIFAVLFNFNNFQIIDLEKCICYTYNGKHISMEEYYKR